MAGLGKILKAILKGSKKVTPRKVSKVPDKPKPFTDKEWAAHSYAEPGHGLPKSKGEYVPGKTRGLGRGLSEIPVQKRRAKGGGLGLPKRIVLMLKAPKAPKAPKPKVVDRYDMDYIKQMNTLKTVGSTAIGTTAGIGVGMGIGGALTRWQADTGRRIEERRIKVNKKFLRDHGGGIRSRGIARGQGISSGASPPPLATYDLRKRTKVQLLKSAFGRRKRK